MRLSLFSLKSSISSPSKIHFLSPFIFISFSTNQKQGPSNVGSTFKNKVKLTEFYKYIHPDLLNNAPERVKEENARSLKILNAYFDSCHQNQKAERIFVKFYIPDKTNKKSRHFQAMDIQLDPFAGNSSEEQLRKHTQTYFCLLLLIFQCCIGNHGKTWKDARENEKLQRRRRQ
jgi:Domain of unknown function (DUF4460)